ncbi:hypothetical protein CPB84DRAFT_1810126 [Gymnopilus junonius]|uniref:Uncharacterized protein n=1 Tax=Gymnopilus junonius TaxID=109634 RepID=A0A9P5N6L3_GYMJU|nr:hypothetical protein CPB84DRAFT_1810126 [Gymnopilus junonius]
MARRRSSTRILMITPAAHPLPSSSFSGLPSTTASAPSNSRTSSRMHLSHPHSTANSETTNAYIYVQCPFHPPSPPLPPTTTMVDYSPRALVRRRLHYRPNRDVCIDPPPPHPDRDLRGYLTYRSPSKAGSNLEAFETVYGPGTVARHPV